MISTVSNTELQNNLGKAEYVVEVVVNINIISVGDNGNVSGKSVKFKHTMSVLEQDSGSTPEWYEEVVTAISNKKYATY